MTKVAVIAIGGNSLIKDKAHQTVPDQFAATRETCIHIARMIAQGWNVVITHGNGPQVGFILRRSELSAHELHTVPLDSCGADTQGAIGYMIQQNLYNEFKKLGLEKQAVTVVTQVRVDPDDTAFQDPTKYIGSFMDETTAKEHATKENWTVKKDADRGWRRVVASPIPKEIIEVDAVQTLIKNGFIVIAVGGGGIPVIIDAEKNNELIGTAAVIDKDYASALLASSINADLFLISTSIDKAALNFGTPDQKNLDRVTLAEAKQYLKDGHFPAGSMGPKVKAIMTFLEAGGKEALITLPENIEKGLAGQAGTRFVP